MVTVEQRLVPRYHNVPFEFTVARNGPLRVTAVDASKRAARFSREQQEALAQVCHGRFTLGETTYQIERFRIADHLGRDDACIVEYDATEVPLPLEIDEAASRYHEAPWLRRFLLSVLPGRVSRIHLYEAQERYLYLWRLLEYFESLYGDDYAERKRTIHLCRKMLKAARVLLVRRQHELNFLWRELTQVHMMILDRVIPPARLPAHLDFCREETRRLAMTKDPEISEALQRLAEITDSTEDNKSEKVRLLRALIERFTTIRTGRMHEQFVTIQCYLQAFLMLLPIIILLVSNYQLVLGTATAKPGFPSLESTDGFALLNVISVANYMLGIVEYVLAHNLIAFVFFAGLTGGFFSVAIRLRTQELVPGEDAYFMWYVLTKPWVGALGAAILFILLRAQFVQFELGKELLQADGPGPGVFAFAFLAGFSERIVFPTLK